MPQSSLRELLLDPIIALHQRGTHAQIPSMCDQLGLPSPGVEGSKRERMQASYDIVSDADLPRVAENLLRLFPPSAQLRNQIQDVMWAVMESPEIPKLYRREVSRSLSPQDLYLNSE